MPTLYLGNHAVEAWGISMASASVLVCIVAPVTWILGSIIYNLYFHPLRKYPGPILARSHQLFFAYHWWHGTHTGMVRAAHEKYGEVVRVAPNDLSYTDPQAWKDIYGHRHGVNENGKAPAHMIRDDLGAHDNIITAPRDKHAQLRKLLSNAFSDKSMREQEPIIRQYVDLLISRLHSNCDDGRTPLNMLEWYNFTTFDVIGHLAFDESFDCLKNSDYHPWVALTLSVIMVSMKLRAINRMIPFGFFNKLVKRMIMPKKLVSSRHTSNELVKQKVMRRKERSPQYTDFMTHLLQAEAKGQLDLGEPEMNARILIVAGSETTATLLTGATYLLLSNPSALSRLTTEIRSSFSSSEDITFTSVNELPYLLACLNESLRLYPPAPTSFQRVTPPEGATICGDFLPGGTTVSTNILASATSSRNWEEPEAFRPERFMPGEGKESGKWSRDRRDALQPFSYGPRNCIGRNLAYIEMRIILAKVLWSFDLELAEGNADPTKQLIFAVWDKKPLMVRLTPVKR